MRNLISQILLGSYQTYSHTKYTKQLLGLEKNNWKLGLPITTLSEIGDLSC